MWLAYGAGGVLALAAVGFAVVLLTRPAKSNPPVVVEAPAEEVDPLPMAEVVAPNPNPTPDANPTPDPPSVSLNPVPEPVVPQPVPTPPVPPAETKPAEPKPEKPKPAPPKPEPAKPTTPAKPLKPFDGFATTIELPPKTETKEVKLGPAKMPDDFDCVLHLLGGDIAFRRYNFECVPDTKEGEPTRAWHIDVQGPGATGKRETIAALTIRKDQLMFRWDEKAAENVAAGGFRNCALQISAGQGAHTVALRKPLKAAPMPVSYEKQTESWSLPDAPRPDKVMIEFDIVSSREMPRPRFLSSSTVDAADGEVYIEFGLKEAEKFLKLQVQTKLDTDSLDVTVTPWVQVTGQPKPVVLSDANVKKLQETITQTSLAVDRQLSQMPKTKSPARDALQKQLTACRQAENQLAKLKSTEADFKKQARLKARVYLLVGSTVIELVTAK